MIRDGQLLSEYVECGSQAAFTRIVEQHLPLVYATCLREVHDVCLAEDVTQVVFLLLAHKAPGLRKHTSLAGWLFQTARFASRNARRQESRRKRMEQKLVQEMASQSEAEEVWWESIEPMLHPALQSLNAKDREALLLRFFEGRSIPETGVALGVSEGAAQMRISRAVERLRRYFRRHGISLSAVVLLGLLTARASQAVPAACRAAVLKIASNAVAGQLPAAPTASLDRLTRGVLRTMWTGKVVTAILLSYVLLIPTGGYSWVNDSRVAVTKSSDTTPRVSGVEHAQTGSSNASLHTSLTEQSQTEALHAPQDVSLVAQTQTKALDAPQRVSTVDNSLNDDPQLNRKVAITAEGIPVGDLMALLAKQTGVRFLTDAYTADDKVIVFGPARPLKEIMADLAALYNDTWVHSNDNGRHTYHLTRLGPARDREEALGKAASNRLLAYLEELDQALKETPEQLKKRPETDPIRQTLTDPHSRVTTSILGLLSPEQREQLIETWRTTLPVSALNSAQQDGIESLFHGQLFEEMRKDPLFTSGAAIPPAEIPRDQMAQHAIKLEILNASGVDRQGSDTSIYLSGPAGFNMSVATFSSKAKFLFPAHGNPYTTEKIAAKAPLPDPKAVSTALTGAWLDRLRTLAEKTGVPLIADYYRSKSVMVPGDDDEDSPQPSIAALDDFCKKEGYLWWNRDKTLLFRKRDWYNQRLYEVPDRWVLALSQRLKAQQEKPTYADVLSLLDLTTNQIVGLNESLGLAMDRRILAGFRELLVAITAIPGDKNRPLYSGILTSPTENNLRRASLLSDPNDRQQQALLNAFGRVFDPNLFKNPDLDEFGIIISNNPDLRSTTSSDTVGFDIVFYTNYKGQQGVRMGYLLALPKSLPDDRRDKTTINVVP